MYRWHYQDRAVELTGRAMVRKADAVRDLRREVDVDGNNHGFDLGEDTWLTGVAWIEKMPNVARIQRARVRYTPCPRWSAYCPAFTGPMPGYPLDASPVIARHLHTRGYQPGRGATPEVQAILAQYKVTG
jgi:hypothetical protein